jgi:molybdopterin molybdotransferase
MQTLLDNCGQVGRKYTIDLEYADNRILSRDIMAPRDFPHFDQSHVDGYAVRAADSAGKLLKLVDEGTVGEGTCMLVHTGGALPEGADAIFRLEDTEQVTGGIKATARVTAGENFMPRGTVLKKGQVIYHEGAQLKPTDIGTLARLGFTQVEVYEKPRVLIIPTGDELVERGKKPGPGSINDGNGLMCYLAVKRYGGKPALHDIVRDDLEALKEALKEGLRYDLVITTGGTSVGFRDRVAEAISSVGQVLIHGVAIKPGRPMGIGYVEGEGKRTPVMFLPGVMEACAVTTLTFAGAAIRKLGRYPEPYKKGKVALVKGVRKFPQARAMTKLLIKDGHATPVNIVGEARERGEYAYLVVPEGAEAREGDEVEPMYLE